MCGTRAVIWHELKAEFEERSVELGGILAICHELKSREERSVEQDYLP